MKTRRTLIAFAIMVALGAATWYFEVKKQQQKSSATEKERQFLSDLPWASLQSLRLKNQKTDLLLVKQAQPDENKEDLYTIAKPLTATPDQYSVRSLVNSLKNLRYQRVIKEKADQLAPFGLEQPPLSLTLTFKTADGKKLEKTLLLGEENPGKEGSYAKLSESPRLLLLGTDLDFHKNLDLFYYRDKQILDFKSDRADFLQIERLAPTKEKLTLAKEGEQWWITAPHRAAADTVRVSRLLSALSSLRAQSFPSDHADADAAKYGLARPGLRLSLGQGNKAKRTVLTLGTPQDKAKAAGSTAKDPAKEKQLFARRDGSSTVAELSSEQFTELGPDFAQLVSKELVGIDKKELRRIRLVASGTTVEVAKDENNLWHTVLPVKDLASAPAVDDLLDQLARLRGEKFLGLTRSLPKAEAALTLILTRQSPAPGPTPPVKEATVMQVFREGANGELVAKSARTGYFYSLAQNELQRLTDLAQRLRDRRLIRLDAAQVGALAVQSAGKTIPVDLKSDLAKELLAISGSRFQDQIDTTWKKTQGLDQPQLSFLITPKQVGAKPLLLPFGNQEKDGRWALNENGAALWVETPALAPLLAKIAPPEKK